tara:strand:+ start:837 stop:1637 length:801 start_codon:yes stop_codon:yes gene_type:complete
MKGPINNLELRVMSMMRSGHHAIISWIFENYPGSVYFRNDVLESKILQKDKIAFEKRGDTSLVRDCFIFNIEDAPLSDIDRIIRKNQKLVRSGQSKKIENIVVIRDPFNLFASRIQKIRNVNRKIGKRANYIGNVGWADKKAVSMWKEYAELCLGIKKHLSGSHICVNYNLWVSRHDYRNKIANKIGFKCPNDPHTEISNYGSGSSFHDVELYAQNDGNMPVLNRWKNFLNDQDYLNLFRKDKELIKLYGYIFGDVPKDLLGPLGL